MPESPKSGGSGAADRGRIEVGSISRAVKVWSRTPAWSGDGLRRTFPRRGSDRPRPLPNAGVAGKGASARGNHSAKRTAPSAAAPHGGMHGPVEQAVRLTEDSPRRAHDQRVRATDDVRIPVRIWQDG